MGTRQQKQGVTTVAIPPVGSGVEVTQDPLEGGSLAPPSRKPKGGARRGAGRPKGRPNTSTMLREIAEDTRHVYEDIGGREAFAEWASKNRDRFYGMLMQTAKALSDSEHKEKDRTLKGPEYIRITLHNPDGSTEPSGKLLRSDIVGRSGGPDGAGSVNLPGEGY